VVVVCGGSRRVVVVVYRASRGAAELLLMALDVVIDLRLVFAVGGSVTVSLPVLSLSTGWRRSASGGTRCQVPGGVLRVSRWPVGWFDR
jgi:hypothetical protein